MNKVDLCNLLKEQYSKGSDRAILILFLTSGKNINEIRTLVKDHFLDTSYPDTLIKVLSHSHKWQKLRDKLHSINYSKLVNILDTINDE